MVFAVKSLILCHGLYLEGKANNAQKNSGKSDGGGGGGAGAGGGGGKKGGKKDESWFSRFQKV